MTRLNRLAAMAAAHRATHDTSRAHGEESQMGEMSDPAMASHCHCLS